MAEPLFARRLRLLMVLFAAVAFLLIARLAQFQLLAGGRFDPEKYARAGGDRLVETVRGGIYTGDGLALARQVPSFDVGVQHDLLLLATEAPWEHESVRRAIEEFLRRGSPAVAEAEAAWEEHARASSGPGASDTYERLWARRHIEAREYGSLGTFVVRRLLKESRRSITADPAHGPGDWLGPLSDLTGTPADDLRAEAQAVVRRVERIRLSVEERARRNGTGLTNVRVVEQNLPHALVRDVSRDVAAAIRARPDLYPGTVVMETTRREYVEGDLAPHIVGELPPMMWAEQWDELGIEGRQWMAGMPVSNIRDPETGEERYTLDDRLGASGVESAYEEKLQGSRGYVDYRLAFGLLRAERKADEVAPVAGSDVHLTIRSDFQRAANKALSDAAGRPDLDFDRGSLVIIDVRDGAILAAATYPSYDLTTFRNRKVNEEPAAAAPGSANEGLAADEQSTFLFVYDELAADPRSPFLFRPCKAALPTGSVYKVITAIAALEEGKITPETTFHCAGSEQFAGRRFHCEGVHGTVSLLPAIERSCNIYFYRTGLEVGGEALSAWGAAFGLGQPTGVDLSEQWGLMPEARHTHEIINLAIGQGALLCTPLQVANAMAAIANGGRLYTPRFVSYTQVPGSSVVDRRDPKYALVGEESKESPGTVREETRANLGVVRQGMRMVVQSPGGTAWDAGLGRFRAAGKSGTAQLETPGTYHAWFAGFAPYEEPKVAFAVVNELTGGHGGSHAAPIVALALEPIWQEIEAMP
jgi:penicillin-binding protein 2